MKLPIQYALTYPTRQTSTFERLDFWKLKDLTFEKPDTDTFKGLRFAYEAGKMGGSMPCVFNAANEVAVGAFLKDAIHFLDIYRFAVDRSSRGRQVGARIRCLAAREVMRLHLIHCKIHYDTIKGW